ncbi:MAG: VacJ family lipoprotein [Deltaproteobacteria bacterium]|nr:VacJ family lipoprotein [Deltaproteobacteria bacterium]MBW2418308.1 VacJ family lipoprotein [Deltaproteobacteria bacterium]
MRIEAAARVVLLAGSLVLTAGISLAEPAESAAPDPLFDEPDPLFDDDFDDEEAGFPDPWENSNRKIFAFNRGFDRLLLYPVMRGYAFITPKFLRLGLRNFFRNINQPVVMVNDAFQLEWKDAGITVGALVVNTTVGIGGLWEPAKHMGMPRHYSDFGQTLALAGADTGPYMIIPIAGPTTVRDGAGALVDIFLRPATWVFGIGTVIILYRGGEGFVVLEEHYESIRELERSSVDFYAVLHAAYSQNRMERIWGRRRDRWPEDKGPLPIQPEAPPVPSAPPAPSAPSGD